MSEGHRKDKNLDLLRAAAIALVLLHHIAQTFEFLPSIVRAYTGLGAYGVDLFFVLSGFLIGTLFFREFLLHGRVLLVRFWARRWLRTLPLYYAALVVSYAAVVVARKEPFHFAYLFFAQNYLTSIPFFLVSWSLCVEEHFYFFAPAFLWGLLKLELSPVYLLIPVVFAPLALRIVDPFASPYGVFGYSETATHLRCEGLVCGVLAAYLRTFRPSIWSEVKHRSKQSYPFGLLTILSIPFWSTEIRYFIGFLWVSVVFTATLIALVDEQAFAISAWSITWNLAKWSYSIYLSHALVIHFCVWFTDRAGFLPYMLTPVWLALILSVGHLVYRFVEEPSLRFRERFLPPAVRVAVST